jgi:hypothetical protein
MNYKEVIEALHKKRLDAEAGGGGGGAGAGGGAAGGSGGASAGGSATGSSGDGGSADGGSTGDSGTTSSADSTSSEPTTSRGGFFVGYGGYWSPPGKKKKKKKKKAKVGSVKDGIYEGDIIDARDKFGKPAPEIKVMARITLPNKQTDWLPAYSGKDLAFAKDKAKRLINPVQQGVSPLKPEDVKISVDGVYIAIPELQITESQEEISTLEDKLYKLEGALGMARNITRDIKYVDTHIEIISKLAGVAEDVGLELDKYDESKVLELKNDLESAIYQLEEPFEDAIRDIQNKIDELEYEDN